MRYNVCLQFVHIQYITESNVLCVKILLHSNIQAKKAALVRNYFSRRNYFGLNGSWLPSLSCLVIFEELNTDVLFRRVNYL